MATILESLVSDHYFPRELPPSFTSAGLLKLPLKSVAKPLDPIKSKNAVTKGFHIDIPLGSTRRRQLTVPNPKSFLTLCREVHDHWYEINNVHGKSPYSVIAPLDWDYQVLKDRLSQEQSKRERIIRSHEFGYLVKADIQEYFHTIYTHSIAWAFDGKTTAKAKIGDMNLMGNRLDVAAQKTQDNQTNGLPVGPRTSLILSELIGCAMDLEIQARLKQENIIHFGQRAVDDFKFYVRTPENAERTLSIIQSAAADYHLRLNPDKSEIVRLPEIINAPWVSRLRALTISSTSQTELDSIVDFFNEGFEMAHRYPRDSVLRFLMGRLLVLRPTISAANWPVMESLLLKTAGSDGRAADLVHRVLLYYSTQKVSISPGRIGDAASAIVEQALPRQHEFEGLWGLHLLLAWKQPLSIAAQEHLEKARHPLLLLLGLALGERKLLRRKLDVSDWEATLATEDLDGAYWMALYETSTRKWLSLPDLVPADPFFQTLRKAGVSFMQF